NQPMSVYSPATLVKDAQRHGLKVKPIDVQCSNYECTLETLTESEYRAGRDPNALRMGLRYARGLRKEACAAIVDARHYGPFSSVYDLARRVPELRKNELVLLAQVGALNSLDENSHRRDALWQAERAGRSIGPLLQPVPDQDEISKSPLFRMTDEERLVADFAGTGLTVGPHPMSYHRQRMNEMGISRAVDLAALPSGRNTRIAGSVIARQRPGTANGFVFLSIE